MRRNIPPPAELRGRVYYHGTPVAVWGQRILRTGRIEPREMTKVLKQTKAFTTPVRGKVYLTPSREQAVVYALWDRPGVPEGRYGYIFEIPGDALQDVEPDEDVVGMMAAAGLDVERYRWLTTWNILHPAVGAMSDDDLAAVGRLAEKHLSTGKLDKLSEHEYVYYAYAGKKLLPRLPKRIRAKLLEAGAAVAHSGPIRFTKAWRLPKTLPHWKYEDYKFDEFARRVANPALKRRLMNG